MASRAWFYSSFWGVDVTHGKGSIAPYVFINNEIIPIVTDQSIDMWPTAKDP